ncbi:hypothetical protein RR48_05717 [Papilio machaon]|uniref:Uncharacterized protein n=1 Tax=Papilio machaon TaxID=76193 RepID=A0A0N1PFY3_PAPMA|nr:hypothetical protein RR48_05717 [Papilio machaon]
MGKKDKRTPKANVFKVAGAKSLKKTKAKAVNLGLKNIKQKIGEIDKQFLDIKKNVDSNQTQPKNNVKAVEKQTVKNVTKEEVAKTAEDIVKMDL